MSGIGAKLKSEVLRAKKESLVEEIRRLDTAISTLETELSVSSYEKWKEGKSYASEHPDLAKHRAKRQRLQGFLTKLNDEISASLIREKAARLKQLDTEAKDALAKRENIFSKYKSKLREAEKLQEISKGFTAQLDAIKAERHDREIDTKPLTVKLPDVQVWLQSHFCIDEAKLLALRNEALKENSRIETERILDGEITVSFSFDFNQLSGRLIGRVEPKTRGWR